MQIFENDTFVVEIGDDQVRLKRKDLNLEIVIEPLVTGMSAHAMGKQMFIAHGRDGSLLVFDRLSIGMPPVLELR